MSRVWKRFLLKVAKGVSMIGYVVGSLVLGGFVAYLFEFDPSIGIALGAVTFVILPLVALILRDTYRDAKYEVERENRDLLRSIGGRNF